MFVYFVILGLGILKTICVNMQEIAARGYILASWLVVVLVRFHLYVFKEFEHNFWSPVYFNLGILSSSGLSSEFVLILFQI